MTTQTYPAPRSALHLVEVDTTRGGERRYTVRHVLSGRAIGTYFDGDCRAVSFAGRVSA